VTQYKTGLSGLFGVTWYSRNQSSAF